MRDIQTTFYSDGLKLDGSYFEPEPDEASEKTPIVIACSGFTGLKHIHPERFARSWTKRGFICFGFDYRGFGESEGARGRVQIHEQVRDIANATQLVKERAQAEGRKLVLAGWGMAGGLIIHAAKLVEVDALIAMNGFYNALRVQKALRGEQDYKEFRKWLGEERLRLAKGGAIEPIDPFKIYPLDRVSEGYVDGVLRRTQGYGITSDITFADSLLLFRPEEDLDDFAHIPILIAHGAENSLHPVSEAKSLFSKYPGPKELFLLEDAGHTEWMLDDNPLFQKFAARIADWMAEEKRLRIDAS